MENKFVKFGIVAAIIGIGVGLYALYKQQLYYAMQYCYKIYKIAPKTFSKDIIEMDITIKILNRSNFSLLINSYSLDISVNDNFLTTIKNDQQNTISPNGVSYIKASINVTPANILKPAFIVDLLKNYIIDKSKIIIEVKGSMSAKANFISLKKLPINYKDNLQSLMTPSDTEGSMECPKEF